MFPIDKLMYFFVFCIAIYILVKHFFTPNDDEDSRHDLDRMIEEKKRSLGGGYSKIRNTTRSVKVKEKVTDSFLIEIQKNLEWGVVAELDLEISEAISDLVGDKCVLQKCSNIASNLLSSEKNKLDFLKGMLLLKFKETLKGKDTFMMEGLKNKLVLSAYLISIGKIEDIFDRFDGSAMSLKKVKIQDGDLANISSSNIVELISKLKPIASSLEKLILLNEAQISSLVIMASKDKSEYKKFLKTYHPDTMDLHIIPKAYKEKYMKIYSHQFSKIKELIDT